MSDRGGNDYEDSLLATVLVFCYGQNVSAVTTFGDLLSRDGILKVVQEELFVLMF